MVKNMGIFYWQIHGLEGEDLKKRNVTFIDIANDPVATKVPTVIFTSLLFS